jgi:alkylhydroperoxidase family enzyme
MPRIPYLAKDLAEPRDLVETIRARRGGELLDLDRMLLYSLPFAKGWNAMLREVRNELALSAKLRELAICAVAKLNDAEYEFQQHAPEFEKAGGTAAQAAALGAFLTSPTADQDGAPFDAAERAVLRLATEMTRQVKVSDSTFAAVRAILPDDGQIVELVGVIAAYNMVSRFLAALEIEPE